MNKDPEYVMSKSKIQGTPEQFAAMMIDWCREHYRIFMLVPRITLSQAGAVIQVDIIQAQQELLNWNTYDDAFEILNGKTPDKMVLEPGYRYIYRKKGRYDGTWRPDSSYHKLGKDWKTAVCGAAEAGQVGFELVIKAKPVLRSKLCNNCAKGIVTRQEIKD
jgi:hypothetical protein